MKEIIHRIFVYRQRVERRADDTKLMTTDDTPTPFWNAQFVDKNTPNVRKNGAL